MLGALAGGMLLNLMPCVFPILALKALHLAQVGRRRRQPGAMRWPMRRARWSGRPRSARLAGDPRRGQRGGLGVPVAGPAHDPPPAAAGHGDHAQSAASVRASGTRRSEPRRPAKLRHRRTRRLRRHAVRRAVPRRRARHGPAASAVGSVRCSRRSGWGWPCRSCVLAFIPALRRRLPRPGAWMATIAAYPRHPDGGDRARLPVVAVAARRGSRLRASALGAGVLAACCCAGAAAAQRAASGPARRPCSRCWPWPAPRCLVAARPAGVRQRAASARRRGARPRCARNIARGQAGVRLFHRRLVPDLQGQ